MTSDAPLVPRWGDGTVADVVPAVLEPGRGPAVLPDEVVDAGAVVVLVIDGLGWRQLEEHGAVAPTLRGLSGGPITTVAPSTTGAALTSITTGRPPGEHGIVGYRIAVDGDILNCLSWRTSGADARDRIVPERFQPLPAFAGERPVVVQNAPFVRTGFTRAHHRDARQHGWRTMPTLPVEVRRAVAAGESFVYAYYDGIDKIAHEFGFGEHYRAELASVDRMVADLLMALPRGTAVVVTADHGLVDCTGGRTETTPATREHTRFQSGEGRFSWFHAEPGRAGALAALLAAEHGDRGWVRTQEQILDEGWFGPIVTDEARRRLGDVALLARGPWWFTDPGDATPDRLIGRHGSLTEAEMLVPLLSHWS